MTKMLIDIDEDTLATAQRMLGTATKKDTVNTALRETAARVERAGAWAEAQAQAPDALDLELLKDKKRYRPKPEQ